MNKNKIISACNLFNNLKSEDIVVSFNPKLSVYLSYKFDSFIKLNNKSLINVYFFSVEDFLTKIWKDTKNNSLLLKSFQESILWEEIVKKYNNKSPLINTIKTAEYARKVYHCSKLDEIKIEKYDSFFHSCIGKFEIKCQTNNWTSLPQIVEKIPTLLKIKNLFLGRLFLVDFPYFPLKSAKSISAH